ncbi:hypothetical protein DL546_009301 [Coniochaeta pulveracea]|uniref:Uncharacterized protein n=1 Tax=Coniochaeta pulveracea TaxID=177199 RepID=A0A420YHE5_9PEZI|nr:hypothetical protein DL546_009301 [Coniochaeta pulveracea]
MYRAALHVRIASTWYRTTRQMFRLFFTQYTSNPHSLHYGRPPNTFAVALVGLDRKHQSTCPICQDSLMGPGPLQRFEDP